MVVIFAVATVVLSEASLAQTGQQLLDGVRDDARRQAQSSLQGEVNKRFPYNGSLYGLPGQTQSASIRNSAITSALGGMFGNCKQVGAIDLTRLPSNLKMDVSGILSNTAVQVPEIRTSSAVNPMSAATNLIPSPTQIANGQVKVGGDWMSTADYQKLRADTQAALQQAVAPPGQSTGASGGTNTPPATQPPTAPAPSVKPAVSKIWGPPNKS